MSTLVVPSIHLNGTGRDALLEQLTDARGALYDALVRLQLAAPNGRDYYLQGSSALGEATRQHEARLERVRAVYDELGALGEAILDT